MEAIPKPIAEMAREFKWPKPHADGPMKGRTTLEPDALRRVRALLNALVNYIETQLARCKETNAPSR